MYITYADALKFLQEAIAERGEDYVNPMIQTDKGELSCVYRVPETGEPSCGVGVVLAKAGFDLNSLSDYENGERFPRLYEKLRNAGELYMHPSTRQLLRFFQEEQDNEHTWGYALSEALHNVFVPDPAQDVMPDVI